MILVFLLFWIIVGWSLYDGEMYFREALFWGAIWAACVVGFFCLREGMMICIAVMCLVDIILIIRQFGGDIRIG